MLRTVKVWQHVLVGLSIVVMALLAGFGLIGAGDESLLRPEHFDAKQVTVWPDGSNGVRIREVVDVDFGLNARHGYQRIVTNSYGEPVDVVASSPDANADVTVVPAGAETRIRIGDTDLTFTDRHRYILEYTLPEAQLPGGVLALDIIGNEETFETERFEIVLTGFDFDGVECDTGAYGAFGGCEFVRDGAGNQVAVIAPLDPGDGITVGGRFTTMEPTLPPVPDAPGAIPDTLRPLGLAMIPLGILAAGIVFFVGRSYGSNDVAGAGGRGGGGAADAAFGDLPVPGSAAAAASTYRVSDSRLAQMAAIEFSPPRGLEPWQGAVLLGEEIDDGTVTAWFSEMIAIGTLVMTDHDGEMILTRGTDDAGMTAVDQANLQRLFATSDEVELGTYDPAFTATWNAIKREQQSFIRAAGWWSRGGPGGVATAPLVIIALSAVIVFGIAAFGVFVVSSSSVFWRLAASPQLAVVAGFIVPLVVAAFAYRRMFASRTATGSALALRSESFRRFLVASEGKHVEWAWEHGLLREYSAWAVALDAAPAWTRAVESSNIPDPQVALGGPLLAYTAASSFHSTHTAPSSSGGGGGGGGGGVGSGGGGGSSGSW